ncbi:MAG: dockerin type I repeat-containing protein, partial [Candidatus Zixiibacteriota bacterium]
PAYEGQPCGVRYDTPNGIRILLAFPLYYLTESSARQLVGHVTSLFGEAQSYVYGDVDGSGEVDIADLVYFVDYSFNSGPAPFNMNAADVDGTCTIDIGDVVYMVDYMFSNPPGPAPVAGCYY